MIRELAVLFSLWLLLLAGACSKNPNLSMGAIPPMTQGVCSGGSVVDDFLYQPGGHSSARAFGRDGSGALYVAGTGAGEDRTHVAGIVRKSTDNGSTWSTIDDFRGPNNGSAINSAMAVHSDGRIWVGTASLAGAKNQIAGVRYSTDGGVTWSYGQFKGIPGSSQEITSAAVSKSGVSYFTVTTTDGLEKKWYVVRDLDVIDAMDKTKLPKNQDNSGLRYTGIEANGVAVDFQDNIYVVGTADETDGLSHWIVRKSGDNGKTFVTVDDFVEEGDKKYTRFTYEYADGSTVGRNISMAKSIAVDEGGNVFVAGHSIDMSGPQWIVRRSSDHGQNWETIDAFRYTDQQTSTARFIMSFGGTPVTLGMAQDHASAYHWVTRSGLGGGENWVNTDDVKFGANLQAFPFAGGVTSHGDIFIVGEARDDKGVNHWTVRRLNSCK